MDDAAVRARLQALIDAGREDYAALSRRIGRNPAYIQQYLKRGVPRRLREDDRSRLAHYFGVPERELGGPPSATPRPDERSVLLPYVDDECGCDEMLAFPTAWLRQAAADPAALSIVRMAGDSMAPTLADGDHALVNAGDRSRVRDGLYALRQGDSVVVKRLAINAATRRLSILNDNARYPRFDDCDPDRVAVVGRVVWIGRYLA